jgi:hypothetical protein
MDVADPDGTTVRFHFAPGRPAFMGVSGTSHGQEVYERPTLEGVTVLEA